MKITPEDMDAVRDVLKRSWHPRGFNTSDEQRDIALALILVRIWDRGYAEGYHESKELRVCPYSFSHTREWCGYAGCRES